MFVQTAPGLPTTFRRVVRKERGQTSPGPVPAGEALRTLVFPAGVPVEVKGRDLKAIAADIGVALVEVREDDRGRFRPVRKVSDPAAEAPQELVSAGASAEVSPSPAPVVPGE